MAQHYFNTGEILIKLPEEQLAQLRIIKNTPASFNKDQIIKIMDEEEFSLNKSFEATKQSHVFNEDLANEICLQLYYPILTPLMINMMERNKVWGILT